MNNIKEIWKDIPQYERIYQASNWGNIKRLVGYKCLVERILKSASCNKYGHQFIVLYKNNIRKECLVHRLVLETFIGPCPFGMECRHLDGNPKNNKLDNLCWGTKLENIQDRRMHGTESSGSRKGINQGINNGMSTLNNWIVRIVRQLLKQKVLRQKEIAKIFSISDSVVSNIKYGKIWKNVECEK